MNMLFVRHVQKRAQSFLEFVCVFDTHHTANKEKAFKGQVGVHKLNKKIDLLWKMS